MAGYIGPAPVPQATQNREAFTATSGQTSFATAGYTPQFIDVYLNGVKLAAADYTATNGSDVVLASGAASGDILEVVAFSAFTVADQAFTGTTTAANLTVTGAFTSQGIDDNADAVAITIDSSENVGIGTSSPAVRLSGTVLTIDDTSTSGLELANSGSQAGEMFSDASNTYISERRAGSLIFRTAGSNERMRIDASGRVILGGGSTVGDATADNLTVGQGAGNEGATIYSSTTGYGSLFFKDSGSNFDGYVQYKHGDNYLRFGTATAERIRIDSSGRLLQGSTSANMGIGNTTTGSQLSDYIVASRTAGAADQAAAYFNKNSLDGDIVQFRKDGSTVGSIGNTGSRMYLGSGDVGAAFQSDVDKRFYPVDPSNGGAGKDAYIDLGRSNIRWKDLYLSGGVYLGGTGSANKISDYETGAWTPVLSGYTGVGYTNQNGYYTKVGRLVVAHFRISISSIGTFNNNARITGLPFRADTNITNIVGNAPNRITALNQTRDHQYFAVYNAGYDMFCYTKTGGALNYNIWQAGDIEGVITYFTP